MTVRLQSIQLIMDKTNTVDLSHGVFSILISVTVTRAIKSTKSIAIPQIWKFRHKLANSDVTNKTKEALNWTAYL